MKQKDKRWWEASLVEKLALMHSFGEGEQKVRVASALLGRYGV